MKMRSLFLFFCLFSGVTLIAAKLSLSDAIQKQLIRAEFSGYHDTSRTISFSNYGKSMLLKLENLSNENLDLELESGYQLVPVEDQDYQTMVVTATERITIRPGHNLKRPLFAMCCESGDAAPGSRSGYSLGNLAEPRLLGLVKLIEKNDIQDYSGQQAVWALINNEDIMNVYTSDLKKCGTLRKYLCDDRHLDYKEYDPEKILFQEDNASRFIVPETEIHSFVCEVEYKVTQETKATLIIIDETDKVLETLFENRPLRKGTYQYTVEMQSPFYDPGKIYYLRLIANDRIAVEKAIMVQK